MPNTIWPKVGFRWIAATTNDEEKYFEKYSMIRSSMFCDDEWKKGNWQHKFPFSLCNRQENFAFS